MIQASWLRSSLWVLGVVWGIALVSGCAPVVIPLTPVLPPVGVPGQAQRAGSIGIERLVALEAGQRYADSKPYEQELAAALQKLGLFHTIATNYIGEERVDFLLRGNVSGEFVGSGAGNFLNWFPGPLLLSPHWRGTRFTFDTGTDLELVDLRTEPEKVLVRYRQRARHLLIDRADTPLPLLAAATVLPGILLGAQSVRPTPEYRKQIYEKAFGDLWAQIAARVAVDLGGYYADRNTERTARCGEALDADPLVDGSWSEFVACQRQRFFAIGQEDRPQGVTTIYQSRDSALLVYVVGDRISSWSRR